MLINKTDMETKRFKPFDRVIARCNGGKKWICNLYSHYDAGIDRHVTLGFWDLENKDILPYEGNEHLVGTSDEPDEEVRLEEGEWVFCTSINILENAGTWSLCKYIDICCENSDFSERDCFLVEIFKSNYPYHYAIRFCDFNPEDMEETKKHILCVRNGKVVKYKG